MNPDIFADSIVLDDTQLWFLNSKEKSFPLFVTLAEYPAGSGCRREIVEPALPARPNELAFLHDLDAYVVAPVANAIWVLAEGSSDHLLRKAPGITPSYYYRGWAEAPGQQQEPAPVVAEPVESKGTDAEEFLKYFHSTWSIVPLEDLRVLWHMISAAMFHWLYRRREVLDFGCVKLVAMPYRKDWAAVLWAANPKIRTLFLRPDAKALLLQSDWYDHIKHPLIAAVNRHNNTCCWTLHAIETDCWKDSVATAETRIKAAVGIQWYGQHWLKTIEKHETHIFDTFEAYLAQTNLPHGRVAQSGTGLAPVLIPHRATAASPTSHPVLRLADGHSFDQDMAPLLALEAQNAELHALPAIPFLAENVRDAGDDLPSCSTPPT